LMVGVTLSYTEIKGEASQLRRPIAGLWEM